MNADETYQGWTNWHTWNCNLWLTNDEYSYKVARSIALVRDLKEFWVENFEGQDGIKTSEVNFDEIYDGLKE